MAIIVLKYNKYTDKEITILVRLRNVVADATREDRIKNKVM